jgi:tetratricopeptide (TPR) repeat protein
MMCAGDLRRQREGKSHAAAEAAERAYDAARAGWADDAEHADRAWRLGRACFDWAEHATNDTHRAALAREGIAACERALSLISTSAPAHYYLGMNRGQLARTMTLGALKLVSAMEQDFLRARALDRHFDEAGPDRNLGLLYLFAPGWPVSLGNQKKARSHLEAAVELVPLHPGNRLNLMEAYARWGRVELLRAQLEVWNKTAEKARVAYSGESWRWDWQEWDERLRRIRAQLPSKERAPPAADPSPEP